MDQALRQQVSIETPIKRHMLTWVRRLWLVSALYLFIIFLIAIPGTYQMLQTPCVDYQADCMSWAQPTPTMLATLEASGISSKTYAGYLSSFYVAVSLVFWVIGFLIYHYRSNQWFALLVAHLMVLLGAGGVSLVFASGLSFMNVPEFVQLITGLMTIPVYQLISIFLLTFPNGRFYGRWNLVPFILICLNTFFWITPVPALNIQHWPSMVSSAWLLIAFGSHLLAQVIRYRQIYTYPERLQTKWLIYGFSLPMGVYLGASLLLGSGLVSQKDLHPLITGSLTAFLYLPIGISIGIAILRHHLWDIDVVINRTLVYATLTITLVGIYALTVGAFGLLIQTDNNFVVSLLGAGLIAVIFEPLRGRIQRGINRFMFGQRAEPINVMTDLSKSLEVMVSPEAALQHLVTSTAIALKLPYVAILNLDHAELISFGRTQLTSIRFPLIYQAQLIGTLLASPRTLRETLNGADQFILENVARLASAIVHTWRLTEDLQKSRQQILSTREEERRRLRRDLHDGLGPALATLTLQAEAAQEWLNTNPLKSAQLLEEITKGSQATLANIRQIVYSLRPPALDELGLISAIREQATQYSSHGLLVSVEAPKYLPTLPAAVEVAVYRIVQEALTNVVRHAEAHFCKIHLGVNGKVEVEIVDDGIGIPLPYRAGVGLSSIHERAAELGGACVINSSPGEGTRIKISLPRE